MILGYWILSLLSRIIPPNLARFFARIMANIMYWTFYRGRRRYVFENLKAIKGKKISCRELHRLAMKTYENWCVFIYEFLILPSVYKKSMLNFVTPVNIERVRNSSVALAAHLGNWEWGAATLSELGFHLTVIAQRHPYKYVTEFFTKKRRSAGLEVVYLGEGMKKILNTIKNGDLVATLGDRDYTENYMVANLMGKRIAIPRGIFEFALKTNVPVIPSFCLKEKEGYKLYFEKAIEPFSLNHIMDNWLQILEKYIRKYPTQWYMFDDIWIR